MQAIGDHIVLIPPDVQETSEGGIVLPQQAQKRSYLYGRVLAIGDGVPGDLEVTIDELVVFDRAGMRTVEWGAGKDAKQHWVITGAMVLHTITEDECRERGWPLPPEIPTRKPVRSSVSKQIKEATEAARA